MIAHNPPNQGGIVQYCILLANELHKIKGIKLSLLGFKSLWPHFLYPGNEPDADANAIDFDVPINNLISWWNPLSWIRAWGAAQKSDVIHLHWYTPLFAPIYYTLLTLNGVFSKKRVVVTCHNIEPHEDSFLNNLLIRAIFSHVNMFIVHAEENKRRLQAKYSIAPERISVIMHGTFGYFRKWPGETREMLREHFNIEGEVKHIILFFGYIRKYKGLKFLIEALPAVLKEEPHTKIIVAGALWGDWEKQYGRYIKKHGLEKHIIVRPSYVHDREVHKFFDVSDIVVLPYYNTEQTISGPLLVSFAFGKPTIVSGCGGIRNLVANGKNAVLAEPGNPAKLADSIINLLRDKKLQSLLSKHALESVKGHTWDKVAAQYTAVYNEV